jgi:hypothetical protein
LDPSFYGLVAFGQNTAVHSIMEEDIGGPQYWMREVVSGQPTLLWAGALRDNPNAHCGIRRARTATGFSESMETMYMAVVDEVGGSSGMTCNELAALMQSIGAHSALNQDGGGSSTMFVKGQGVVSSPSDGSQRSVVTHWGVQAEGIGPPDHCVSRELLSILDGVKRHITSPQVLADWKLEGRDYIYFPQDWVDAYQQQDAFPSEPRLLQAPGESAIYLVDGAFKRHVPSPRAMAAWRFSFADVIQDQAGELDTLVQGPPLLGTPMTIKGDGPEVYIVDHPRGDIPDQPDDEQPDTDPSDPDGSPDDPEAASAGCTVGGPGESAPSLFLLLIIFIGCTTKIWRYS